jgi:multimeric flavodoxin WrbA
MQKVYKQVLSTDMLLFSSPIYWFNISAQLKLFFDRLYAVHNDSISALKGIKIGLVLTYGDSDPFASGAVNAIRAIQDIANYTQAQIKGIVYGTASALDDAKHDKKLVEKARALGKALADA